MALKKKTPAQILSEALALIEQIGWVKGEYGTRKGGVCSMGAVYAAAYGFNRHGQPKDNPYDTAVPQNRIPQALAADYLTWALPAGYYSVVTFNDKPKTQKRSVVALFKRAIKAAQKAEQTATAVTA